MTSALRRLVELLISALRGRRPSPTPAATPKPRCRNTALMLMYSGAGYRGMQRQPGQPTIEGALLDCLLAAGRITPAQRASPASELDFGSASRTDSGVSALAQLVTIRMEPSDCPGLVRDMNSHLPARVRVLDAVRVTKGFSAKHRARNRTYAYLCPSFAFAPGSADPWPSAFDYRIDPGHLESLRRCMGQFLGTRNYYNFTSGRGPGDPSCSRHLFDCWVAGPSLYRGLEFLELRFVGQSFILHQIRKMVGMCIAIARGHYEPWALKAALCPQQRVDVPRAPGLGLLLCDISYEPYNRSHADRLGYPTLDWSRYEAQREAFQAAFLMPDIFRGEAEGRSMLDWLQRMRLHQLMDPGHRGPD